MNPIRTVVAPTDLSALARHAVVRDDIHGAALGAAGVERVLNPFNDAADYAARAFAAEIAYEDAHRADAAEAAGMQAAGTQAAAPALDAAALQPAADPAGAGARPASGD